jgi:hypothetical protein
LKNYKIIKNIIAYAEITKRLKCLYVLCARSEHSLTNYKVSENEHKNNLDEIKVSRNIISFLYADEFYDSKINVLY